MQGIAQSALQLATIHAVIRLQMPDGWFNRSAPLEPLLLFDTQAFEIAPVNDLFARVVCVHATKAQIDHDVFELGGVGADVKLTLADSV